MNRMEHLTMASIVIDTMRGLSLSDTDKLYDALSNSTPGRIYLSGWGGIVDESLDSIFNNLASSGCLPTHLDLSENDIFDIPDSIGLLTGLLYLDLCDNMLTYLPSEIWTLTDLLHLDLSHNKLTHLSDDIVALHRLSSLKVNGNRLDLRPCPC